MTEQQTENHPKTFYAWNDDARERAYRLASAIYDTLKTLGPSTKDRQAIGDFSMDAVAAGLLVSVSTALQLEIDPGRFADFFFQIVQELVLTKAASVLAEEDFRSVLAEMEKKYGEFRAS